MADLDIDPMTGPLVNELQSEVVDLIERVDVQMKSPNVQPLGLLHTASASGRVGVRGTIETKVIRASDSVDGKD